MFEYFCGLVSRTPRQWGRRARGQVRGRTKELMFAARAENSGTPDEVMTLTGIHGWSEGGWDESTRCQFLRSQGALKVGIQPAVCPVSFAIGRAR